MHMTVKSTGDGEDDHKSSMADRVAAVQAEPWRSHRFVDAETEESWGVFQENFFAGGAMGQDTNELLSKVPKLVSGVNDEQYLDMISAPIDKKRLKKAKDAKKARQTRRAKNENGKGKEAIVEEDDSSSTLSGSESDDDDE